MLFAILYGIFSITLTLLALLLVYGLVGYIKHVYNLKNYPPGPFPLPFIGNLRKLGEKPYLTFIDLAKVYGDVFSVSLGMQRIVIINKIEPAKEALITKSVEFAGRPTTNYIFQLISRGRFTFSIIMPYYDSIKRSATSHPGTGIVGTLWGTKYNSKWLQTQSSNKQIINLKIFDSFTGGCDSVLGNNRSVRTTNNCSLGIRIKAA